MWRTCARRSRWVLGITLVLLIACERETGERVESDTAMGGREAGREYTNAELTGLLIAYYDGEIEVGELAQANATDTQVRDFAQRTVQDNRGLRTAVTDAARQQNITPSPPGADSDQSGDHREIMGLLPARPKGREFDETFLQHEVAMHRRVLNDVEGALGGNRNQEIRAVLEQARGGLRAHLQTAEELERKFASPGSAEEVAEEEMEDGM